MNFENLIQSNEALSNNTFVNEEYQNILEIFENARGSLYYRGNFTFEDFRAQRYFPKCLKTSYSEDGNIIKLPVFNEEDLIRFRNNFESMHKAIIEHIKKHDGVRTWLSMNRYIEDPKIEQSIEMG